MLNNYVTKLPVSLRRFVKSVWFFPAILFCVVLLLGALQLNGSSIGIYHQIFYGSSAKDNDLLFGGPRSIRSDEWLVATPLALGQVKNNFATTNKNIGDGINMSLIEDVPVKDVTQFFRPQNWFFFIVPVGIAFALKWWLLAYLLVISVYFFVLTILPKRKKLAIGLALCFLASPFIAWWYQYITLASIYYTLFGVTVAIQLMRSRSLKAASLWGLVLAYVTTSFALVLYPPFQIPCALFAVAFLAGYVLDSRREIKKRLKQVLVGGGLAICLTVLLLAICLVPKLSIIKTINDTAYPGHRLVESGGFNPKLFFASNTSLLDQNNARAGAFTLLGNQSEGSNFLLVFILLAPLLVFFVVKYRKKLPNFWMIIMTLVVTVLFLAWLFVPGIDGLGKITLLNRVLHARLLMGLGLINLLVVILLVQVLGDKRFRLPRYTAEVYAFVILAAYVLIDHIIAKTYPGFMGPRLGLLLALPYAIIAYFFIKRKFGIAVLILLLFSLISVCKVDPVYRGVSVLTNSDLSKSIQAVDPSNSKRWVTDSLLLENFAILNGKQSLSGVYAYPDLGLWKSDFTDKDKYNRYAHVHFQFDRNAAKSVNPTLEQPAPDQLVPSMEPCDNFLREHNVGYLLTAGEFSAQQAPCAKLLRTINEPAVTLYIYKLDFNSNDKSHQ